jgi:hypothetical protein
MMNASQPMEMLCGDASGPGAIGAVRFAQTQFVSAGAKMRIVPVEK